MRAGGFFAEALREHLLQPPWLLPAPGRPWHPQSCGHITPPSASVFSPKDALIQYDLDLLHLQRPYFRIRSSSEVPGG